LKEEARRKKVLALSAVTTATATGDPLRESESFDTEGSANSGKNKTLVTGALDRNKTSDIEAVWRIVPVFLTSVTQHRAPHETNNPKGIC